MLNNKVILIIIISAAFLLGCICGVLLSKWDNIKCTFFDVKITELVQIILTLIIAIFITSFVTTKTSNKIRRRDIVLDLVAKLQDRIDGIYEIGCHFLEKPVNEK